MFNFFTKANNSLNLKAKEEKENVLCSVSIELTHDGAIDLRYFWPKFDENNKEHIVTIAYRFGRLLYMINSGLLEKDMVDTLSNPKDKNNIFDREFTKNVLTEWLQAMDEELNNRSNSDPVVSPSNVFGQYKQ